MTDKLTRTQTHLHLSGFAFKVTYLKCEEAMNSLTEITLTSVDDSLLGSSEEPSEQLHQPVSIELTSGAATRWWHGCIIAIDEIWQGAKPEWRFVISNKLSRGHNQHRSRLWMALNREQVIRQLLTEVGYADYEIDLKLDPVPAFGGPHLQAGETNLACFERLLAEVGANYWFEHSADKRYETLVIRNDTTISPYLPKVEWAQSVSGLAPDAQLNRIVSARPGAKWIPAIHGAAISHGQPGALSRDDANQQQFEPPRPRREAEQRALFQQQHRDQDAHYSRLKSHQPLLTPGYTLVLDAGSLANQPSGEYRILSVTHEARQIGDGQGLSYRNTATGIPRSTPVRAELKNMSSLPLMFPARIESPYAHADLDHEGRYYFRADFDDARRPVAQASARTERIVNYASPLADEQAVGWHFPLLNQASILITCLNNDPARPAILGFLPERRQLGPVTHDNATQNRIVSPGQNELLLEDEKYARRIALFTFDGQNCLELNHEGAEIYSRLLSQFGSLSLKSGRKLTVDAGTNLEERIGQSRSQTVKQNYQAQTENGAIRHQAQTEQNHHAQQNFNQKSDGDYSIWVQQQELTIRTAKSHTTKVTGGDLQLQVKNGAMITQVNGDITIQGNGGGDILLTDGTGGIKIDRSGNIKLFGKKVTIKGTRSGVVFDGNVSYETGGGNEVEQAAAVSLTEPADIELLELAPYQPTDQTQSSYEKAQQERILTVSVLSPRGMPLQDVKVVFETVSGTRFEGSSNAEGVAELDCGQNWEEGTITYPDDEDLLHKSFAADIRWSLQYHRLRTLCQLLQAAIDYEQVRSVYQRYYGDIENDVLSGFPNDSDQDVLIPLLVLSGLMESDEVELQQDE